MKTKEKLLATDLIVINHRIFRSQQIFIKKGSKERGMKEAQFLRFIIDLAKTEYELS